MQYLRHQKLRSGFGYILIFSVAVSPFNILKQNKTKLKLLRLDKANVLGRKENCLIAQLSLLGNVSLSFIWELLRINITKNHCR